VVSPRLDETAAAPVVELVVAAALAPELPPDAAGQGTLAVRVVLPEGEVLPGRLDEDAAPAERGQQFRVAVPLLHGVNSFTIELEVVGAPPGPRPLRRRIPYQLRYRGSAPGLRLRVLDLVDDATVAGTAPGGGGGGDGAPGSCAGRPPSRPGLTAQQRVCVELRGTAAEGAPATGVVRLDIDGIAVAEVPLDRSGRRSHGLRLLIDRHQRISAELRGATDTTRVSVELIQDSQGPLIELAGGGEQFTERAEHAISGRVSDPGGLGGLWIESGPVRQALPVDDEFRVPVQLTEGANQFTLVAEDGAGNRSARCVTVQRSRVLTLERPPSGSGHTLLWLDRYALEQLLGEDEQKELLVARVPLRPTVRATLERVLYPERHGVDTGGWGPAERNLQRLLRMSPDTADLRGSALAALWNLSHAVGLPGPRLLAEVMELGTTESFIDIDTATDALLDQLVATHPAIERRSDGAPVLPLSLYDVLQELRPLARRLGPVAGHPGFLDGVTAGRVLEPGFQLSVPLRSNLVPHHGIDLVRQRRDQVFLRQADQESALDLDFLSPEFSVAGLVARPALDLTVRIGEHAGFVPAGTGGGPAPDETSFPRGSSPVWDEAEVAPWQLERIIAEAAYRRFSRRHAATDFEGVWRHAAGSIQDAARFHWNRGWLEVETAGDLGDPPPARYVWDLLLEVAQLRLHEGLPEGRLQAAFALRQVPIGFSAEELVPLLRAALHEERTELSQRIAGPGGLSDAVGQVFFLPPPGAGADGLLVQRAGPGQGGGGFYRDATLRERLSQPGSLPGAVARAGGDGALYESVAAVAAARYFVRDGAGRVNCLEVVAASPDAIRLRVSGSDCRTPLPGLRGGRPGSDPGAGAAGGDSRSGAAGTVASATCSVQPEQP
jgi:hypothetical protein